MPDPIKKTILASTYVDDVCHLTMRSPAGKPPTLDYEVIEVLERTLGEIEARAGSLIAVVLQSASPKFFCAGANLNVMETIDRHTIGPWVHRGHAVMNRLEALPLPVIARVEGYAMGGGLELAMACDLIFASTNAHFAQSEARLGLVTGWGGCFRLARRVGLSRAKELCFTGRMLDAAEAVRLGVADWQGEPEALDGYLATTLAEIGRNGRVAVREMKAILSRCTETTLGENAAIEATASERCLQDGDAPSRLAGFFAARKASRSGPGETPAPSMAGGPGSPVGT
jgi:enoyl-CoA hydratase